MAHWANGGEVQSKFEDEKQWEDFNKLQKPSWKNNFEYRIKPEPEFVPFEAKDIRPDWIFRKKSWSENEWTRPLGVGVFGVELSIEIHPNGVCNFAAFGFEDLNKNWEYSADNGRTWFPCQKEKV